MSWMELARIHRECDVMYAATGRKMASPRPGDWLPPTHMGDSGTGSEHTGKGQLAEQHGVQLHGQ